jgi:dTDP-4-amino-4,6-dideoxygalactose transaminase
MIPLARPYLTKEEAQAAYDTIMSGWITQGPRVETFEEKFAEYTGAHYAVAVSNCTTALHLSLIVSGIGPGDEVICPSLTYIATANAIMYTGARPVFADVLPTYNLDPADAEKKITNKTKAILLVHQMGVPADIDSFTELCEKYNLLLIEDAACAVGSGYRNKKIGAHSSLVCFSFHPRKVMSTGDGGMITTNREDYYHRLKLLRQHGMSVSDRVRHESKKVVFESHLEVGFNYRLTDIQAAVGICQLEKLDWIIEERRRIASIYNEAFCGIDCLRVPEEMSQEYYNYQSYCVYLNPESPVERDDVMQEMLKKGIATRRGIMTIHREPAYRTLYKDVHLPVSEDLQDNSIILPLYVPMKTFETEIVIDAFLSLLMSVSR